MSKYNYIKWFDEIGKGDVGIVGGKGANLGELTSFGLPVPPGFCVTASGYTKFIKYAELDEVVKLLMEAENFQKILDLKIQKLPLGLLQLQKICQMHPLLGSKILICT